MSEPRESALRESTLAADIEFLFAKAAAEGTRAGNRCLAAYDLRVRSYSVLALATGRIPVTQRELAEFLSLDPSQIVALVDDLESSGLVRREVDPSDRRSRIVTATDAGRERFEAARRATTTAEDERLAGLTVDERSTLRRLLAKVVFNDASA